MAGWISSKLKVAETFLQQIDQQAAESLGKNEKPRSETLNDEIPVKAARPLKDQLKKKTPERNELQKKEPERNELNIRSERRVVTKKSDSVAKQSPSPVPTIADSDWTELLGSPKQLSPTDRSNGIPAVRTRKDPKKNGVAVLSQLQIESKTNNKSNGSNHKSGKRSDIMVENKVNLVDSSAVRKPNEEESSVSRVPSSGESRLSDSSWRNTNTVSQNDKGYAGKDNNWFSTNDNLLLENKDGAMKDVPFVGADGNTSHSGLETYREKDGAIENELHLQDAKSELQMVAVSGKIGADDVKNHINGDVVDSKNAVGRDEADVVRGSSVSHDLPRNSAGSDSNSETDSASTSDSENENERREERRKRRQQMLAEEAAARAVEAIKERENIVAKLEGEKQSLEKILEEREKQQAQEASELQMNMMETLEAAELEKEKLNSTRMEVLIRLAELESTNAELARSLATSQWNLEVEVDRVAELRKRIELKELANEELRRRIFKVHKSASSLSQLEAPKGVEFEREILEAEYSVICDKIGQLQEKAKKLEENIEMTRKEMEEPTALEVELKRRLAQLTDLLIQKQAQVESLTSEKATLLFRLETTSRLIDENKLSVSLADDIEAGAWGPSNSRLRPLFQDRIRSGKQHLGFILRQLDAIFSAGVVFLRRKPAAQLWALVYLICLHFWVMYILMSHSRTTDETRSGAVISLDSINKTV